MDASQLEGYWLNQHIRDARESVAAAEAYENEPPTTAPITQLPDGPIPTYVEQGGPGRAGPTSRELSGEMGGDTVVT